MTTPNDTKAATTMMMKSRGLTEQAMTGPISHDEAVQIAARYNVSHWREKAGGGEMARYSIPANPKRDDDIRLLAYIEQQRAKNSTIERLEREALQDAERNSEIVSNAIDPSANVEWMRGSPGLPEYVQRLERERDAAVKVLEEIVEERDNKEHSEEESLRRCGCLASDFLAALASKQEASPK